MPLMMFLWNGKKLQLTFCVSRTSCLKLQCFCSKNELLRTLLVFLPTNFRNSDWAVILADDLQDWASAGFYLGTGRPTGRGRTVQAPVRHSRRERARLTSPRGLPNHGSGRVAGTLRDPLDTAKGCKKEAPLTLLAGSIRRSARTCF